MSHCSTTHSPCGPIMRRKRERSRRRTMADNDTAIPDASSSRLVRRGSAPSTHNRIEQCSGCGELLNDESVVMPCTRGVHDYLFCERCVRVLGHILLQSTKEEADNFFAELDQRIAL